MFEISNLSGIILRCRKWKNLLELLSSYFFIETNLYFSRRISWCFCKALWCGAPYLLSTWYFLAIFTRFVPDNRFHARKFCSDHLSSLKTCIIVSRQSFCGINQSIAVIFFVYSCGFKKGVFNISCKKNRLLYYCRCLVCTLVFKFNIWLPMRKS